MDDVIDTVCVAVTNGNDDPVSRSKGRKSIAVPSDVYDLIASQQRPRETIYGAIERVFKFYIEVSAERGLAKKV